MQASQQHDAFSSWSLQCRVCFLHKDKDLHTKSRSESISHALYDEKKVRITTSVSLGKVPTSNVIVLITSASAIQKYGVESQNVTEERHVLPYFLYTVTHEPKLPKGIECQKNKQENLFLRAPILPVGGHQGAIKAEIALDKGVTQRIPPPG